MKTLMADVVRHMDHAFNSAYFQLRGERKALLIFLFHALFKDEAQRRAHAIQPSQGMSIERFCQFIEYYRDQNYTFVSPEDICRGLGDKKNYVLITFDDGYYNNAYALPILERYDIPALFFISTSSVKSGRAFWWDVLYREKIKQGMSEQAIAQEITALTSSKTDAEMERYVFERFGEKAFCPVGDIDRPFTPQELKDFSQQKSVFLGNHTNTHAYLANSSPEEVAFAILTAQRDLQEMTGKAAAYISYPHGSYSQDVLAVVHKIGFKLGMAVDNRKNYLPIGAEANEHLRLGRFALQDNGQLMRQCHLCRADIRLTNVIKDLIGKK